MVGEEESLRRRAAVHAALAEPVRLAAVDELMLGDRSPSELAAALRLPSNLLAHHLRVLQDAAVVTRSRSEADRRRTYLRLVPSALAELAAVLRLVTPRVVFVCTHNSARSQLAAALWSARSPVPVASAGTRPAERVHQRAAVVARRNGLSLAGGRTARLQDVLRAGDLVVAVCDSAHEQLGPRPGSLHWSVPDPVRVGTDEAFEHAFADLDDRVRRLVPAVRTPADDLPTVDRDDRRMP